MASRTPCSSFDLLVHADDAEGVAVERDRRVEVRDGDADVVDLGEQAESRASANRGKAKSWQRLRPPARACAGSQRCLAAAVDRCASTGELRCMAAGSTQEEDSSWLVSVIVNGARTPMGRLLGSLKDFSGADLGGVAIKAALERSGRRARAGPVRDHGPGAAGRRRPDPGPPGRAQGRHPAERSGADRSTRCACPAWTRSRWPTSSSAPASSTSSSPAARSR